MQKTSNRYFILSQGSAKPAASGNKSPLGRAKLVIRTDTPKWIIRYVFYAFVFSLPFEAIDIGAGAPASKLLGLALAAFALFQPRLCYKFPPKAFWWFAIYLFGFALSGAYLILTLAPGQGLGGEIIRSLLTRVQLVIFFWISYNLLHHERIVKGTLWALAASTMLLGILQLLGITSNVGAQERVTAFAWNPNVLALALSLGLLALVGLAFGREKRDWKALSLFWLGSGILAVTIVQTGSRGAVVGLVGSLSVFFLKGKSLPSKIKLGLLGFAGIIILALASYQIEPVRARWEQTFYEGRLSGRDKIFAASFEMILERPLLGWGPVNRAWELGSRLGMLSRDEHNLYLMLLAEGGIVGAMPFLVGLWLCWRGAWRARRGIQGVLPLIMLLFILVLSLSTSPEYLKLFWIVLAYALASSSYVAVRKSWKAAALSQYAASPLARSPVASGLRKSPGLAKPGIAFRPIFRRN